MLIINSAFLTSVTTRRGVRHNNNNDDDNNRVKLPLVRRTTGGATARGCRARRAAATTRCAAGAGQNSARSHQSPHHVRELLPPSHSSNSNAQLVATIAAKAAAPPPPQPAASNSLTVFCRANWPLFVLAQTVALFGAAYSGISSRNKRVEVGKLNDQLRAMMEKMDESNCKFDWSVDEDEEDDWPGSKELSEAKRSLEAEDVDAALAHFAAAKNAVMEYSGPDLSGWAPSVQYFTVIQQHIHAPSLHTEYVFARVLGFE